MKTNNPRKNREAKEAAAASGSLGIPEISGVVMPEGVGSGGDGAAAGERGESDQTGPAADVQGVANEGTAASSERAVAPEHVSASGEGDTGAEAEAIAVAAETAATASGEPSADAASEPAAAEAETVAFSSATELLAQSQQEIKKAKAAVARQKRAKEMEALQKKMRARKVRKRVFMVVLGIILLAILALVLAFCANRWWLHDDAADIQGIWQVDGSNAKVTFTEDSIVLTDEVAYRYELDPEDKTIRFSFGNLSGEGYYRFSLDRNQLSVTDGETSAAGDLMEDIGWWINALIAQVQGYQLAPTIGADSVGFTRVS